ncbi:hypothetical protein QFW82_00970 [Streptomyces malaysiensis subsp. malaysiensis]|uniref:hypothetical protein n=1 Tax=Streptomyces malaysiensis TaxID=92644 RepID=UPI0024C02122|nr:hypothetical protein [Streptomyces sp. NA07423]WHX24474.1 hypothetical protein QFW82_00970 [Streptomyces sp. NA07423]
MSNPTMAPATRHVPEPNTNSRAQAQAQATGRNHHDEEHGEEGISDHRRDREEGLRAKRRTGDAGQRVRKHRTPVDLPPPAFAVTVSNEEAQ